MPRTRENHSLAHFEPVLRLANAKIADENALQHAFGFYSPRHRRGVEVALGLAPIQPGDVLAEGHRLQSRLHVPYEIAHAMKRGFRCSQGHEHDGTCIRLDCFPEVAGPDNELHDHGFTRSPGCQREHTHTYNSVLLACFSLGGKPITTGAITQLRNHMRGALIRFQATGADLLDQQAEAGQPFFTIHGRRPMANPQVLLGDDGIHDTISTDLQDIWFSHLASMIADLKVEHQYADSDGNALPFRPLLQCPVCREFVFRAVKNARTCGRRECIERERYLRRGEPEFPS